MAGMGSSRASRVVVAVVLLLSLAACTSGRAAERPDGAARGPCAGVGFDDVRGAVPSYAGTRLARFPNDDAVCRGLWLPTADRWFVPQGLALDGDTAWVSGYRWHRGFGERACRLLHVSLRTGRLLASTDKVEARVYGPRPTFCRHGGALSLDRHGLWVVESNRLWLVDPARVGRRDQVRRVWRLEAPLRGSVLVDGSRAVLGVGGWRGSGPGRMRWFRYRDVLAPGVTALVAGGAPGTHQAGAVRTSATVRRVQGASRARGPGAGPGVWATASTSSCGMLVAPGGRRFGLVPGAEGLEFDGRGGVWVVSESAARSYQRDGRPLVPMLSLVDVRQLLRGRPAGCDW
jgi:hypothetical protein